ncbi:MAG: hypothetical protein K2X29_01195 [Candidatus Obscuribacterales bacterium]|nr:hypothetical protein [Candidatus Obscuribacterales bacterium]
MTTSRKTSITFGIVGFTLLTVNCGAFAQATPPNSQQTDPSISTQQKIIDRYIAQAPPRVDTPQVPNPTVLPTDLNPVLFGSERSILSRDIKYRILKRLPERLWFNFTIEESQRYESNVTFKPRNPLSDYVFRTLPNISIGYNIFSKTAVYCNWFLIKDVFAKHRQLSLPVTQSLSLGFRHDIPVLKRGNLQFDFQARELWQAPHLQQADLLPSVNFSYVVTPSLVLFSSSLLQLRSHYYFQGATREIDPFFTGGFLYRRGKWNFTATNTYVANFRNRQAIPPIDSQTMISDFELSRPVSDRIPNLVSFVRAEPVWNWGANNLPGLSGFDIRIFGGLRISGQKPAFNTTMENLRKQIRKHSPARSTWLKECSAALQLSTLPSRGNPPSRQKVANNPVVYNTWFLLQTDGMQYLGPIWHRC